MWNLQVAVADAAAAAAAEPWATTREHKSKWPGQILSAATMNDQQMQMVEPIAVAEGSERGLGRVEAGELFGETLRRFRNRSGEFGVIGWIVNLSLWIVTFCRGGGKYIGETHTWLITKPFTSLSASLLA